jgi:uncharacterized protein YndB with AHSA1/START domain
MNSKHDTKKSEKSNVPELVIERVFDAPRERVFEAWRDPDLLKEWTSPKGFTIPENRGDFRPGGKWRARMHPQSGRDLIVEGVYQEITEPERIVSTHYWLDERGKPGPETLQIVTFEDLGEETKVTYRQSGFASREDRDGHEAGWKECFDKLEELLTARVEAPVRR